MQEKLGPRATDRAIHGQRESRLAEEWLEMDLTRYLGGEEMQSMAAGSGRVAPGIAGATRRADGKRDRWLAAIEGLERATGVGATRLCRWGPGVVHAPAR
jgi:hypothetical protein